jgi:hypothetical protein
MLFALEIKNSIILSYPKTTYLSKYHVRFSLIDPRRFHNQLIVPSATIIILTLCIWLITLHCCQWFLYDSTFSTSSEVMGITNQWLNWTDLIIRQFEKVEMWISRRSQKGRWSAIKPRTRPNGCIIPRDLENVPHFSRRQPPLTRRDDHNLNGPHDSQKRTWLNLRIVSTRVFSSRKSLNCDHYTIWNLKHCLAFEKLTTSDGFVVLYRSLRCQGNSFNSFSDHHCNHWATEPHHSERFAGAFLFAALGPDQRRRSINWRDPRAPRSRFDRSR